MGIASTEMHFFFFTIISNNFKYTEKSREYYDEYPVTHLDLETVIFLPYWLHLHFFLFLSSEML